MFGSAEYLIDFMDLIELSFSVKEGVLSDHLKENAAVAPDIHFGVIIAISHETLRSSIPTSGYVLSVGLLGVNAYLGRKIPLHEPKSASLMLSPEISTFSGLMSRWNMPLPWMYSIDFRSWNI